ncbi:MAG TPA: MarR family transcriptional regulator [Rhodothermales bacterium]|nr:MarR family transcriptional regulator [Rhodothermales bacterium]
MQLEEEIQPQPFKSVYHRLAVNLHYTAGWFMRTSGAWLDPYDLSLQQYNILRILRGQHPTPCTATVLLERMVDPMSNVSRLVEKLRQKGLVARCTCRTDRRAVDVLITDQGLALLDDLDRAEAEWLETFKTLDAEEVETLNSLLDKLRG